MAYGCCIQENDELVHGLLEYCTGVTCQLLKLMARTGAHMLSNGDSPAGPDMLSPRFYSTMRCPMNSGSPSAHMN